MENSFPLCNEAYALLLESLPRLNKFPREQRMGLARDIQTRETALLNHVLQALYRPSMRLDALTSGNSCVASLRLLWRLARDLGYISYKGYGVITLLLERIGKMIGSWLHQLSQQEAAGSVLLQSKV